MQAGCRSLKSGRHQSHLLLAVVAVLAVAGVICYPLVTETWHYGRLMPAEAFRALRRQRQLGPRLQDFDIGSQDPGDLRAAALASFGEVSSVWGW